MLLIILSRLGVGGNSLRGTRRIVNEEHKQTDLQHQNIDGETQHQHDLNHNIIDFWKASDHVCLEGRWQVLRNYNLQRHTSVLYRRKQGSSP